MADEDADPQADEYAWEGSFERPWEAIEVSADGRLMSGTAQERRSVRQQVHVGVKRGMLRALYVIVDCSRNALDQDGEMRPHRLAVMQDVIGAFIPRYFEQNPISSLALILSRDGRAEMRTELSSNSRQHLNAAQSIQMRDCHGDASLQNSLELARESLEMVPSYMSREVVLFSSSLSTCDPGDIHATIAALVKAKVRVSVFSLLAEVSTIVG